MENDVALQTPRASTRWSALGCAGVGCLSFGLFAVAQIVATFYVLFAAHPEAKAYFQGTVPPPQFGDMLRKWVYGIMTAPNLLLLAVVGDGVMILAALLFARLFLNAGARSLGLRGGPAGKLIGNGLLAGLGLFILSEIVSGIQMHFFGRHDEQVALILKTHHGTQNFVYDFLAVCIVAPFAEELLFRGVLFAGLKQWLPLWPSAIISGAIFGMAHLDPWSFVPLATIGIGLGLLYNKTQSLWPNVVAHATVNAVSLILVYYAPQWAK